MESKGRPDFRIIGENNGVIFKCSEETKGKIELVIQGNGNSVVIEEFVEVTSLLRICIMDNNSRVIIGRGTTIESASIAVADDDNFVIIGEDCMFAQNVTLLASDFHTICNLQEGRRINVQKGIKIDNHVWIGIGVTVLKNTHVMSNSICRAASIIGGVIVPPNTIYPERKRKKKEVTWERERKASIVPMEKPFALRKKIEIQQDSNKEIIFVIENKIDNCFNKIQGWAFLKNKPASESQIYIRVGFKKNKALVVPLRSIPREDVADFFGDKRYLLCGFCQYMPAAIIQKWNIIERLEILICNQGIWKSKIFYP